MDVKCTFCEEPNRVICLDCIPEYLKIINIYRSLKIPLSQRDEGVLEFISVIKKTQKELKEVKNES